MTIDEIYELIAVNIVNCIGTDNWEKAVLNIHGGDTAMGIDGYYFTEGERKPLDVHDFDIEVDFALMELHEITTEDGSNQWNIAEYTLFSDGNFSIDFDYDSSLEE